MSNRALKKLQPDDLSLVTLPDIGSSDEEIPQPAVKQKKKKKQAQVKNLFELLNEEGEDGTLEEDTQVLSEKEKSETEEKEIVQPKSKRKKKKKKKAKDKLPNEAVKADNDEDEIDASIREVNAMLNNHNIGETAVSNDVSKSNFKSLLTVEHRYLNPENEMKRMFGSRVLREEGALSNNRHRSQTRRRQKMTWIVQPKDTWAPIGRSGLSMQLKDTKDGKQCFLFDHSHQYQQIQFQFLDAVESLNPQNIGNILQLQPYHVDALLQLGEVFRMSEDMNMAAEMIERALYAMEMVAHPLFNIAMGTCRLEYKYKENRSMHLALFKHIVSLGSRGCNRTALEFCKLLLSLDPDADPLCAILLIDFYSLRSNQLEYLLRLFNEWEAHRNLSQLPNFAFSVPLAMFQQNMEETSKADEMLQDSLLMFPGILVPLIDKCSVKADQSASHPYFQTADNSQPDALKQLIALYVGRCFICWKLPEVMEWLERNVKVVIEKVDNKHPLIETYSKRRKDRYKGTPRNIYRHILVSEISTATATIPQDIASTVMSFDPLPPLDSVERYSRPSRPNRAQTEQGGAFTSFLRSLMPNYNPNEPAPPGAEGGGEGLRLREGAGTLMDAMREMLNNIQMVEPPVDGQQGDDDMHLEEWD